MTDLRPVVAIDVDGVLLPFGQDIEFNPEHGAWLRQLSERAELIWATSWAHQANWEISPVLGLPQLPVVGKEEVPYWRYPSPLIWVDDMFYGNPCPEDVLDRLEGRPTLFVGTNPHVGLELADFNAIAHWLDSPW